jgi:hydroxymethylpyrimidine pyrophosphatase-like HAD family hydrolase
MQRIRLVVVDVDSVLSHGEAAPLDFAVLQRLAEFNDRARQDPAYPAVTLCTGLPVPYVGVLMQAIHGYSPAVYENGAGLYSPMPYGFKWHPAITRDLQVRLMRVQSLLHDALVDTEQAYFQPGKPASLSVFPCPGVALRQVFAEVSRLARGFGDEFSIKEAATCVNVILRGIDKAEGVQWLSGETGIPLGDMAGVGDSPSDVGFMQLLGWSAAPANAHASVKQIARYTSPYEDGRGLGLISISRLFSQPAPGVFGETQWPPHVRRHCVPTWSRWCGHSAHRHVWR